MIVLTDGICNAEMRARGDTDDSIDNILFVKHVFLRKYETVILVGVLSVYWYWNYHLFHVQSMSHKIDLISKF